MASTRSVEALVSALAIQSAYPFIYLDADGHLLELKVGYSKSEGFWKVFIASFKEQGLGGGKLGISDAHMGLAMVIRHLFQGCLSNRCRVQFARNVWEMVPKAWESKNHAEHQDAADGARMDVFA